MRGILFTEYLEFAASQASEQILDDVLNELAGNITGAYTSVGNYSFEEFAKIHISLTSKLNKSPDEMACQFGIALFARFKELFPAYFKGIGSGIEFLEKVGAHIHEEVKKLYPDAKPPTVFIEEKEGKPVFLVYQSHRPLAAVAQGLASACLQDFGDPYRLGKPVKCDGQTKFPLEPLYD